MRKIKCQKRGCPFKAKHFRTDEVHTFVRYIRNGIEHDTKYAGEKAHKGKYCGCDIKVKKFAECGHHSMWRMTPKKKAAEKAFMKRSTPSPKE